MLAMRIHDVGKMTSHMEYGDEGEITSHMENGDEGENYLAHGKWARVMIVESPALNTLKFPGQFVFAFRTQIVHLHIFYACKEIYEYESQATGVL